MEYKEEEDAEIHDEEAGKELGNREKEQAKKGIGVSGKRWLKR